MRKLPINFAFAGVLVLLGLNHFQYLYYLRETPEVERFARRPDAMQVTVSLAVLGASLFIVLSKKYESVDKHWAFGIIGTIIGFWLRVG
jgi:hypothetical protein